MSRHRWILVSILTAITLFFLVAITLSASAFAAALPHETTQDGAVDSGPAAPSEATTLTLSILSSPWAPLDHNDPAGNQGAAPNALVIEAVITNTGIVTAQEVVVELNYNEDPGNNWVLLEGEEPLRIVDSIGPGQAYYAYWFAAYSTSIGASHQYTVTASASNAAEVATSDNYFGNPVPGETVQTREYRSTGSSGITAVEADVIVGVAYTLTVEYDLGNSPQEITFSPVGNSDFDAGTTRLLDVSVVFSSDVVSVTNTITVDDRIYFQSVPSFVNDIPPDHAMVIFRLLPLTPSNVELCSYAAIIYQTAQDKYDQFFCEGENAVPISGSVSLALEKTVHSDTIQQNEVLTYTLQYSNTGTSPLESSWIWDDVDPAIGSIVPGSVDPPADPGASNANRVAWDLGEIPPAGELGSSGTLTFAVLVDGGGQDLADGTLIDNNAFFGINQGALPARSALTSTVTTTLQAPTIVPSKSDGLTTVGNGEPLTYTLNVANLGSSTATGLIVTDVLPAETTLAGTATPPADSQNGQTLIWTGGTLGDLAPGTSLTITIPVTVGLETADLTVLSNTMAVGYQNTTGHEFDPETAGDETTVVQKTATIHGYVFSDDNGNGEQDAGEAGIPNVVVTLDGGASTNTDSSGHYTLTTHSPGAHVVIETDPANFFSTTPNEVHVDVILDQTYRIDFGDAPDSSGFASVVGTVFEDGDGDGQWDAGEPGIGGVTVTLDSAVSVQTDIYGSYGFTTTVPGAHTVVETDPAGYFSTTPNEIHVDLTLGSGQTVNFGDAQDASEFGNVHGVVFEDGNGNGSWDASEPGIAGVTVTLDSGPTSVTDDSGIYSFQVASAGVHTVVESDPAGYFSTTPNEVHVNVALGQSHQVNFGDALDSSGFASVVGTVFEDSDGDGQWDAGEPGIDGVTVTLDNAVGVQTDIYGSYGFTTTVPGDHTVVETDPAGYFSTTPNEIHVDLTLGSGQTVNFGDAMDISEFGNIHGVVFEDGNGNGEWEAAEPGIANVTVTLDGGVATTTDMYGAYSFNVTSPGVHSIVETDPAGYFSTTPNTVTVKVNLGNDYRVDFGDAQTSAGFASIHGTVFEDLDSSGSWDVDEVGIEGVTVTLESTTIATTDVYGRYVFSTTASGEHTVVETDLLGYFSTTPNTVTVNVTLGNGYVVDFGDVPAGLAQCPADSFEEDDIPAQAAAIDVGETQDHDFCDDPTDWQRFETTASSIYTVTTSSWGQRVDTFLAIYDTDGTTLLVANDDVEGSTDFSSQVVWRAPTAGQYYVNVTSMAGQTGFHTDYTVSIDEKATTVLYLPFVTKIGAATASPVKLQIDVARYATRVASFGLEPRSGPDPRGVIVHSCPDSFEVDDTWLQASAIATGVPQVHSFDSNPLVYAADKDFVWFDLGPSGSITFTVSTVTGTATHLEVFDSEGVSTGDTGTTELVFGDVPAGRYYLGVSPTSTTYGCSEEAGYTLTAERPSLLATYMPVLLKP